MTFAATAGAQQTRTGLRILPEQVAANWPAEQLLPAVGDQPAKALNLALRGIGPAMAARTADFVAMQLEYPRHGPPR